MEASLEKIRDFFSDIVPVRPRNEADYYSFFGWQVSKGLAVILAVGMCISCSVFLCGQLSFASGNSPDGDACKTYRYNSIPLRFASGKAEILAKSGYTAYVGDVEDGVVKGQGKLYGKQGNLVYEGSFDANKFNGDGKLYFPNGQLRYEGKFQDNLYIGGGKMFREDGTLKYEGNFAHGCMEGAGTLYNATQEAVYSGSFQNDRILYQELLGKEAAEVSGMYTGRRKVYTGAEAYCVYMEEIDAIYFGADRSNTLDETFEVSGLYVLAQDIVLNGETVSETDDIKKFLDPPVYEGNTLLEAKDELALNRTCDLLGRDALYGRAQLEETPVFDDVAELSGYQKDYQAYIYVYEKDHILYTFFCRNKSEGFDFYMIGY